MCWGGGDGKASIKRLCLSPYVEEPLNSKVIKSFVPELRSRKCFSCFGNKSWRQHPTRHQLYGHLPPITKTIQVRRTRHAGRCWRSKDELISDVLLWTPTYGCAKAGRPARTYIQQLCEDMGCNPEDLPEVMNDREKWRERVKDIRAGGATWWWWWCIYVMNILCTFYIFVSGYGTKWSTFV